MPVTKSAKKALRQARKRTLSNKQKKSLFRQELKAFSRHPSSKALSTLFSLIDKLAKRRIIHPNKASRLKNRLTHFLDSKQKSSSSTNK